MFILAAVGAAAVSGYPSQKAGSALKEHRKLPLEIAQAVGPMPISLWPTPIDASETRVGPRTPGEQVADAARVGLREAETLRATQIPNTAWTSLKIDTKPDQRIDTRPDHTISSPKVSADAPKPVRLSASMTGLWAPTREACSESPDAEYLPMRLTSAQASAGDGTCDFLSGTPNGRAWDLVAQCTDGVTDWVSDVRLSVNGGELTWASQKGTQTYVRCSPVRTVAIKATRAKVAAKAKRKVQKLAAARPSGPGVRVISGAAVPVSWTFVRAR
jgi:hypothetical protein